MYEYGMLTAPYPDRTAMRVTPMTPTLLIACTADIFHNVRKLFQLAMHPFRA